MVDYSNEIPVHENLSIISQGFCHILRHKEPARIILTVPHDGLIASDVGFFDIRDKGQDGRRAFHGRDTHVWPVVNDVVQNAGKKDVAIDAVRFLMPRIYIDANRAISSDENLDPDTPHQTALDDKRLLPVYKNYFATIDELVTRSVARFGAEKVLFIDCHGFGKQPRIAPPEGFDLILGTDNRSTVRSDIDRAFAATMRRHGYSVFLPEKNPVGPNGDPFSAGHTTIHTAQVYGVDCMQIEMSPRFRTRENMDQGILFARRMADFLVDYSLS